MSKEEIIKMYDNKIHLIQKLEDLVGFEKMKLVYELMSIQTQITLLRYNEKKFKLEE